MFFHHDFEITHCIKTLYYGDTVHEQHHQLGGLNINDET